MNTAEWDKEQEFDKGGMVDMSYTGIDPWTMMIHLHDASVRV